MLSVFWVSCQSVPKGDQVAVADESRKVSIGVVPPVEEMEDFREKPVVPQVAKSVRAARSFSSQARRLGAGIIHLEGSREWQAVKDNRLLTVSKGSRLAVLDGVKLYLDEAMLQKRGRWLLGASDERLILGSVFSPPASEARVIETIVLDPGHGGTENGTANADLGLLEKNLNLDVSERLQKHLEGLGYKVVFTRYDDRVVPLEERPEISKGVQADLFVSVHFNAALNEEAAGLETYMLTPEGQPSTSGKKADADAIAYPANRFDKQNFELAFRIQKSMLSRLQRADRGVKKARFKVLKTLDCPGILVECGFLSNGEESLLISTAAYRERLALSLADAIDAYAKNIRMGEL